MTKASRDDDELDELLQEEAKRTGGRVTPETVERVGQLLEVRTTVLQNIRNRDLYADLRRLVPPDIAKSMDFAQRQAESVGIDVPDPSLGRQHMQALRAGAWLSSGIRLALLYLAMPNIKSVIGTARSGLGRRQHAEASLLAKRLHRLDVPRSEARDRLRLAHPSVPYRSLTRILTRTYGKSKRR